MAQKIVAAFPSEELSSTASAKLRSQGFSIIWQNLNDDGIRRMAVDAPFGSARRIIEILKASGAQEIREYSAGSKIRGREPVSAAYPVGPTPSQDPAPPDRSFYVSSLIGLPLVIECPTPLSSLLGLPVLLGKQ